MKDYKYYIKEIKKDLNLTDVNIINASNSSDLIQDIVNWCKNDLRKHYTEKNLHELEIALDKLENEILTKRGEH